MIFDLPQRFGIFFQDPLTPIMNGIIDLHHGIFYFLLFILTMVLYVLCKIVKQSSLLWVDQEEENVSLEHMRTFRKDILILNKLVHGTFLEIIWTIIPAIILMFIAVPSFALLYSIDEICDPQFTIKVIGNQWYWKYETPKDSFDSYMIPTNELIQGQRRLLQVDNPLILPIQTQLRFIITAADVLHSFAWPAAGIKVDAVPGRLNQTAALIQREGFSTGQCSESCGVNHGFMPINIIAINPETWINL